MDLVKTYQKRLQDGIAAVEHEITARTKQIEGLTKRMEGLKRALELFRSDQAAITELLRTSIGGEVGLPDTRPEAARPAAASKVSPRVKRTDLIAAVLQGTPGLTIQELIAGLNQKFAWKCTASNLTGHLYTNPKMFTHTAADRAGKNPVRWSLK